MEHNIMLRSIVTKINSKFHNNNSHYYCRRRSHTTRIASAANTINYFCGISGSILLHKQQLKCVKTCSYNSKIQYCTSV